MIEIHVDTSLATPEEVEHLKGLQAYQDLVSHLVARGRQSGVTLVIKRPLAAGTSAWLFNTPDGSIQMLVAANPTGDSRFPTFGALHEAAQDPAYGQAMAAYRDSLASEKSR